MSAWNDAAKAAIAAAHLRLPEGASLDERRRAIDAAYPFGVRKMWPYKAWLRERQKYLINYGYRTTTKPSLSPLERLMQRGRA